MIEMIAKIADATGIVGVILLLIAYYLLNINKLSPLSLTYQIMNLIGATFILVSLLFHWNISAVLIEIAWILISLMGIFRALRKRTPTISSPKIYLMQNGKNHKV